MKRVWKQIRFIHMFGIKLFILNMFLKVFERQISNSNLVYALLTKKHASIMKYLKVYIDSYKSPVATEYKKPEEFIIWTMWWQGESKMPECIKMCCNSIRKNANGYKVVIITEDNYQNYIQIPGYIITKFKSGKMSTTHLSDIIRVNLLYAYGGLWIDGGMLVTKEIPPLLETENVWTLRFPREKYACISEKRWVIGILGGGAIL